MRITFSFDYDPEEKTDQPHIIEYYDCTFILCYDSTFDELWRCLLSFINATNYAFNRGTLMV